MKSRTFEERRPARAAFVLGYACAVAFGTACGAPAGDEMDGGEAEAEVGPAEFVSAVTKVYGVMKQGIDLLKKRPDQLQAGVDQIIAEVRRVEAGLVDVMQHQFFYERQAQFVSYRSAVQTLFRRFNDMGSMNLTDPDLATLRVNTQMDGELLLSEFAEIVDSEFDAEVSYQLAESYNMLLATHIAVLQMKEEVTPGNPATLSFYNTQLNLGMQTNYKLIGSQRQACGGTTYPPTQGKYHIGTVNGVLGGLQAPSVYNTYQKSQLFVKKFGLRAHSILSSTSGGTFTCILARRECLAPTFVIGGLPVEWQNCDAPRHPSLLNSFQNCLAAAERTTVSRAFNADPIVAGIRASVTAMMTMGLASIPTPGGAFPGADLARTAYFDPWVVQSQCGANGRGRDYIITP